MKPEDVKKHVGAIIDRAFWKLKNVYDSHQEANPPQSMVMCESRLVFPQYRNGVTKIREQELRCAFVEAFNEYCEACGCELFYSVETPTLTTYENYFNPEAYPLSAKSHGRTAYFDLVVYDENLKRVCLIEYKANNASETDYRRDYLKLIIEEEGDKDVSRFFVQIIKSYNEGIIKRIKGNLKKKLRERAEFRCYALEGKSRSKEKCGEDISVFFDEDE